jgi:hypothetical protein
MVTVSKISCTVTTVFTVAMRMKVIVKQGCYRRIRDQRNASAFTAIGAVGTTQRLELFTMNRNASVATVTCA